MAGSLIKSSRPWRSRVGGRESENGESAPPPGRAGRDERREDRTVAGRGTAFSMTMTPVCGRWSPVRHSDHHAEKTSHRNDSIMPEWLAQYTSSSFRIRLIHKYASTSDRTFTRQRIWSPCDGCVEQIAPKCAPRAPCSSRNLDEIGLS